MTDNKTLLTVSPSPHIKGHTTTTTIMGDVIIALSPALIWGCYAFGLRSLYITLISVASCMLFEGLFNLVIKRPCPLGDLSAVVTGILLAFNLPVTVPCWMPVAGAFFAMVIVKGLFGGIGKNIINPALAARAFLVSSWTNDMTTFTLPIRARYNTLIIENYQQLLETKGLDGIASATPLATIGETGNDKISYSIFDMFIGNVPGTIGEVSALLLSIGFIYLLIRRVTTLHIPMAYIGTVALLTLLFPRGAAIPFMSSQLFSGGLFLGAMFMANDYVTSPVTSSGRILYGVGCGLLTVLFRYFSSGEGVSYAILVMNMLVWYIDRFTKPVRFGGKQRERK